MRGKLFFAAKPWRPSVLRITASPAAAPVPEAQVGRRALRAVWRRNELTGTLEMRWELTDEPPARVVSADAVRAQHVRHRAQALQDLAQLLAVAHGGAHDDGRDAIVRVGIGVDALDAELLERHHVRHIA
jgi:hypothetical protein